MLGTRINTHHQMPTSRLLHQLATPLFEPTPVLPMYPYTYEEREIVRRKHLDVDAEAFGASAARSTQSIIASATISSGLQVAVSHWWLHVAPVGRS